MFLNVLPKLYSNKKALTKSDTVCQDIIKSDNVFYQKILKYFNDCQNRNFSFL